MSVYVDELQEYPESMIKPAARRYGNRWCHLTADSTRELFDMACKLRLSPNYIQRSSSGVVHFDLVPSKRALAIKLGAIEISAQEMVKMEWQKKSR